MVRCLSICLYCLSYFPAVQRVAGLLLLTWQVGDIAAQPALQQLMRVVPHLQQHRKLC